MSERYAVRFDGPDTAITEHPDGPWPRWEMARAAAIAHIEEHIAECQETLQVMRRSGIFHEYRVLVGGMACSEGDGRAQVQDSDKLT